MPMYTTDLSAKQASKNKTKQNKKGAKEGGGGFEPPNTPFAYVPAV